ncbi:MAG: apolipoprotein N-acyltransferase [Mariprofundaceae bacterium]
MKRRIQLWKRKRIKPRHKPLPWWRIGAAVFLGVLMPYAFSPYDFKVVAIFALAAWLHLLWRGNAFFIGVAFGLGWFGVGGWWLVDTFHQYGSIAYPLAMLALLLVGSGLAFFTGVWAWLCLRLAHSDISLLLWFPTLAVCIEWLRGWLFSGLPWTTLGNLILDTPAIGWAAYAGVYGSAFLPCFLAAAIFLILRQNRLQWGIFGLVMSALLLWFSPPPYQARGEAGTVALIQGNIPQDVKWDAGFLDETMQRYVRASERAANHADIIIWPEAAVPLLLSKATAWDEWLRLNMQSWSIPVLFGGLKWSGNADQVQNGMYLSIPGSDWRGFVGKQHLVPFGEYVPAWIPFLRKMVKGIGDFQPAGGSGVLQLGDNIYGSLICYEAIFPEQTRARVREGANVLVNITNDAWYGHSPAAWQHLQSARMRAVESGRYMLRAANTGITTIIAPDGSLTSKAPWFIETAVFGTFYTSNAITPYQRWGDLLLLLFLLPVATINLLRVRADGDGD